MKRKFSVVIRTLNEERYLARLLTKLKNQLEYIIEVIIVDSGSTDRTLVIAQEYNCRIIRIPHSDFSCAYALNVGIENSKADYLAIFSAHSLPVYDNFLRISQKYFALSKVAGVYGPCLPLDNASVVERLFYSPNYLKILLPPKVVESSSLGVLGNTNALLPKRLWQNHPFDLEMIEGGEDIEWADYWLNKGFKIVWEPKLAVYHSHGLTWRNFIGQYKHWQKVYQKALQKHQ